MMVMQKILEANTAPRLVIRCLASFSYTVTQRLILISRLLVEFSTFKPITVTQIERQARSGAGIRDAVAMQSSTDSLTTLYRQ